MTTFEEFKGNRVWTSNRPTDPECQDVGLIAIHLRHAQGEIVADPNTLSLLANDLTPREIRERGRFTIEGVEDAIMDTRLLDLPPVPGLQSVISGEPALLYRTNEAQIPLTAAEIRRMGRRALSPQEFFAICDAVGAIWELHDDFYDPETGEAFQPHEDTDEDERPTP